MTDEADKRMLEAIERLEQVISRFCVVAERQLASNDQAKERGAKAMDAMHPDMDAIRKRVRNKLNRVGGTK